MHLTGESVMATVVIYLSNATQGGQILFPEAEVRQKPSKLVQSSIKNPTFC